jgi:hypothetical protein
MIGSIWGLVTALPSFLSGLFGTINHVTDALANEKINARNAQTEEERIGANERVATLTLRRDVMLAEAGSKLNARIRAGLAAGPLVILLKIFVWDKTIGSFMGCAGPAAAHDASCKTFVTDPLDPNLWQVVMVVLGFYFLSEGAIAVTRVVKAKMGAR